MQDEREGCQGARSRSGQAAGGRRQVKRQPSSASSHRCLLRWRGGNYASSWRPPHLAAGTMKEGGLCGAWAAMLARSRALSPACW